MSGTWHHADNSARSAMLSRQQSDGITVNFWAEDTENVPDRLNSELVDLLVNNFVPATKIYDMLKSVGGPLWGLHTYSDVIPGTDQPIDIVILNFDNNGQPFGGMGYLYGRNAIKNRSHAMPPVNVT